MKALRFVLLLTLAALASSGAAFAWPSCSGNWVSVPKNTSSSGGTLYSTGDLTFQCQQPQPKDPSSSVTNNNSNSNDNHNSNSNSNSNKNTANGGNAVAVAQGGKGGSANQKQHQSQSQGQSQTATGGSVGYVGSDSTSSADNSQANVQSYTGEYSTTYNQVRQAPLAYAPDAYPTAPCRVSGSAGVSAPIGGLSLGGSKLDTECDLKETARAFALIHNFDAASRILCETKGAKRAHLTLAQCQAITAEPVPVAAVVPAPQPSPVINVLPAPVAAVIPPAEPRPLTLALVNKLSTSNERKASLDTGILFLRANPEATVSLRTDDYQLAAESRRYMMASGIDSNRIVFEIDPTAINGLALLSSK